MPELPSNTIHHVHRVTSFFHARRALDTRCHHDNQGAAKQLEPSHQRWVQMHFGIAEPELFLVVDAEGPRDPPL